MDCDCNTTLRVVALSSQIKQSFTNDKINLAKQTKTHNKFRKSVLFGTLFFI